MKKSIRKLNLLLLLMLFCLFGCTAGLLREKLTSEQSESIDTTAANPCNDEKYITLKSQELDSLSKNQLEYFLYMDKACREYNVKLKEDKQSEKTKKRVISLVGSVILITLIVSTIIFISKNVVE